MVLTKVDIEVPEEMKMYIHPNNKQAEMERNALLLYPYIKDGAISHGRAAEILGIPKYELIQIYDNVGLAYLSLDISEIEEEVNTYKRLKEAGV